MMSFWGLGKLLKLALFFILRYIDDPELRQSIENQFNKIEHAHRLAKAIALGNGQEYDKLELEPSMLAETESGSFLQRIKSDVDFVGGGMVFSLAIRIILTESLS